MPNSSGAKWKVEVVGVGGGAVATEGAAADGAAIGTTKPVLVAGQDGTLIQSLKTDTTGRLEVVQLSSVGLGDTTLAVRGFQDIAGNTYIHAAQMYLHNTGTTRELGRTAPGAANTTGTGLLGTAPLGLAGTNYQVHRIADTFKTVAQGAATAETTIWTPASGKKFRLLGFCLSVGAASTLTFKDNTAGTTIFIARGAVDAPIVVNLGALGLLSAAANNVLTVTRGTSATLDGVVWGVEE